MAKITKLADVKTTIFDDLKKVYHCESRINSASELSGDHNLIQLPITEDGVTLNMGGVTTTFKKLNTGEIWGSKADREDPEVTFNVPNVSKEINSKFMSAKDSAVNNSVTLAGKPYKAQGYALELKAVEGSLWFPAENGDGWVILPDIKMYGGLQGSDDSNTSYFSCSVTPNQNKEGVSLYILSNEEEGGESASLCTVYITKNGKVVTTVTATSPSDAVAKAKAAGWTISVSELSDGMTVAGTEAVGS